jgi:undecaprenyl diphosphate synthase
MRLLKHALKNDVNDMHRKGIRVRVIGKVRELDKGLREAVHDAEKLTAKNTKGTINIGINYGGRWDITEAVRKAAKAGVKMETLTPDRLSPYTYTGTQPDPDLIVRTSGEQRLSGFLTWQSAYAELLFVEKPLPAFTKKDFDAVLVEYARRNRRFGGN